MIGKIVSTLYQDFHRSGFHVNIVADANASAQQNNSICKVVVQGSPISVISGICISTELFYGNSDPGNFQLECMFSHCESELSFNETMEFLNVIHTTNKKLRAYSQSALYKMETLLNNEGITPCGIMVNDYYGFDERSPMENGYAVQIQFLMQVGHIGMAGISIDDPGLHSTESITPEIVRNGVSSEIIDDMITIANPPAPFNRAQLISAYQTGVESLLGRITDEILIPYAKDQIFPFFYTIVMK